MTKGVFRVNLIIGEQSIHSERSECLEVICHNDELIRKCYKYMRHHSFNGIKNYCSETISIGLPGPVTCFK